MSNYTKTTNFLAKDSLPDADSGKIIKGSEFDVEFNALQTAVNTKADLASPALTGVPTAPTATAGTNTTQLATTAFVAAAAAAINSVPAGLIALWSGTIATVPSGWYLCNGSNGTPDLRNRFIIGANSDTAGIAYTTITGADTKSGGTKDAIIVSHTHTATVTDPGHFHSVTADGPANSYGPNSGGAKYNSGGVTGTKTTGITVSNSTEGSSGTNQNLPPYYALAYIMKA